MPKNIPSFLPAPYVAACLKIILQLYLFLTLQQHDQQRHQNRILLILINIFDQTHPGWLLIPFQQNCRRLISSHHLLIYAFIFLNPFSASHPPELLTSPPPIRSGLFPINIPFLAYSLFSLRADDNLESNNLKT